MVLVLTEREKLELAERAAEKGHSGITVRIFCGECEQEMDL